MNLDSPNKFNVFFENVELVGSEVKKIADEIMDLKDITNPLPDVN